MKYFTKFYETDIENPYTCSVEGVMYHGIIYAYRKSWFRRRIKKKILCHSCRSCSVYSSKEDIEDAKKEIQLEIEEILKLLNK